MRHSRERKGAAARTSRKSRSTTIGGSGGSGPLPAPLAEVGEPPADAVSKLFLARWMNTGTDLLTLISKARLGAALHESTTYRLILRVLEAPELAPSVDPDKVLSEARIRGVQAREQLLAAEGGTWDVGHVSSYLRLSRQQVDKRRRMHKLLALDVGRRGNLYPAWQFTKSGVLPGWESISQLLDHIDPWAQLLFMLSPNDRLDGKTPLDALRKGHLEQVKLAALSFGEHGAA